MAEQVNTGYVEAIKTPDNYVYGGASSLPQVPLQITGQWLDFLPEFEAQLRQFETFGCTVFGNLNAIEIIFKRLFNSLTNFSERFTGIKAHVSPPGADPHQVGEAIRKQGIIPDAMLPFSDDLKDVTEFYSFKGANPDTCKTKGEKWLEEWTYKHEWVNGDTESMVSALQLSPLCVAVQAWSKDEDLYVRTGSDNHWVVIVGYKPNEYWIVYDTYLNDGSPLKRLKWSYGFSAIKRFHIEKTPQIQNLEQQVSLLQKIINLLKQWISLR